MKIKNILYIFGLCMYAYLCHRYINIELNGTSYHTLLALPMKMIAPFIALPYVIMSMVYLLIGMIIFLIGLVQISIGL